MQINDPRFRLAKGRRYLLGLNYHGNLSRPAPDELIQRMRSLDFDTGKEYVEAVALDYDDRQIILSCKILADEVLLGHLLQVAQHTGATSYYCDDSLDDSVLGTIGAWVNEKAESVDDAVTAVGGFFSDLGSFLSLAFHAAIVVGVVYLLTRAEG